MNIVSLKTNLSFGALCEVLADYSHHLTLRFKFADTSIGHKKYRISSFEDNLSLGAIIVSLKEDSAEETSYHTIADAIESGFDNFEDFEDPGTCADVPLIFATNEFLVLGTNLSLTSLAEYDEVLVTVESN